MFCVAGRVLPEREFYPPALAEGDTEAGFSQMPFDTQLPTQANLLSRFGAAVPPQKGTAAWHNSCVSVLCLDSATDCAYSCNRLLDGGCVGQLVRVVPAQATVMSLVFPVLHASYQPFSLSQPTEQAIHDRQSVNQTTNQLLAQPLNLNQSITSSKSGHS